MRYNNLDKEMQRRNLSQKDIERLFESDEILVAQKLCKQSSFTLKEAEKIRSELFPDTEITYLFQTK